MIDLIYCASGNARFAQIAIDAGFRYGAQLPFVVHHTPCFVDQNWRNPDRRVYMGALERYRPEMATVLDLERREQLDEVLDWAAEAAQYVQTVVIIPKAHEVIPLLPRTIDGATVRLGYSVPTRFGGTELPTWEFAGWPVHLLGGSPHNQMKIAHYMDARSADGNMAMKLAMFGKAWVKGKWVKVGQYDTDLPYEMWAISSRNIMQAWKTIYGAD